MAGAPPLTERNWYIYIYTYIYIFEAYLGRLRCRHAQHPLRRGVKGGEPGVAGGILEAAAQVQPHAGLKKGRSRPEGLEKWPFLGANYLFYPIYYPFYPIFTMGNP